MPIWQVQWQKLVDKLDLISDETRLNDWLNQCTVLEQPQVLAFVNAHAMNLAVDQESFCHNLMQADILFRDGSGMAKLLNRLSRNPGLNLNGTDLIPQIIAQFVPHKTTIALWGTQEPYLSQAKQALVDIYPETEFVLQDGFQPVEHYVAMAQAQQPRLIVLGMGMPRQEAVAQAIKEQCDYPCLIVCGGAIVDFLGGKVSRAPNWVRSLGVEWVYRLILEPKRLFKRYVIGNPLFLWRTKKLVEYISNE